MAAKTTSGSDFHFISIFILRLAAGCCLWCNIMAFCVISCTVITISRIFNLLLAGNPIVLPRYGPLGRGLGGSERKCRVIG